jgi:hypothetical protein
MEGLAVGHDDLFADLLNIEETFLQQGLEQGRLNAEKTSYEEGYALGVVKGRDIGKELGFYFGCIKIWSQLAKAHPDKFQSKRVLKTLAKLEQMINTFPSNPEQEDLFERLESIRAKFKQTCSLLKIKHTYGPTSPKSGPSNSKPQMNF